MSSTTSSLDLTRPSSNESLKHRKNTNEVSQIGYNLQELNQKRQEPMWKIMRYLAIALFWLIWGGLLAGAIIIIVTKNGDVTTFSTTSTTKANPVSKSSLSL